MSTIDIENVASLKTTPKRAEMAERRRRLYELVSEHQPASVRHVFYLAVVAMVFGVTKNDSGYQKVQRALVDMRIDGTIPYAWIVDNTRWARRPRSYDDAANCLAETARLYRRNLWPAATRPSRCGPSRTRSPVCSPTSPTRGTCR